MAIISAARVPRTLAIAAEMKAHARKAHTFSTSYAHNTVGGCDVCARLQTTIDDRARQ